MQQICTMQGSLAFCEWAITGVGAPYIVQPTVYKSIHKPRIYMYMHLISKKKVQFSSKSWMVNIKLIGLYKRPVRSINKDCINKKLEHHSSFLQSKGWRAILMHRQQFVDKQNQDNPSCKFTLCAFILGLRWCFSTCEYIISFFLVTHKPACLDNTCTTCRIQF